MSLKGFLYSKKLRVKSKPIPPQMDEWSEYVPPRTNISGKLVSHLYQRWCEEPESDLLELLDNNRCNWTLDKPKDVAPNSDKLNLNTHYEEDSYIEERKDKSINFWVNRRDQQRDVTDFALKLPRAHRRCFRYVTGLIGVMYSDYILYDATDDAIETVKSDIEDLFDKQDFKKRANFMRLGSK